MESEIFTQFVRKLDAGGEPPEDKKFDSVWKALRSVLIRELERRGLRGLRPSCLGIWGRESWIPPQGPEPGDALDELVSELYEFLFIDRMAALRAHLKIKDNIDGLVFLGTGQFIHERQRRYDPLGTRVFTVLHSAFKEAVSDGVLHLVGGDPRLRNNTILAFDPTVPPSCAAREEQLRPHLVTWCDKLLPDLVVTRGKGFPKLIALVRDQVRVLRRQGIEAFGFKAVVDLVKVDVRRRWAALLDQDSGEKGLEEIDGDVVQLVRLVQPDTELEDRQGLRHLLDCVSQRLGLLEADEKTVGQLQAIWSALVGWAADVQEASTLRPETRPSRRQVGRLLGIPRDRLPGLYEMLGNLLRGCRDLVDAVPAISGSSALENAAFESAPREAMDFDECKAQLRRATGEAVARAADLESTVPEIDPQPGDVYLFRAGADWPVEWVVLRHDPDGRIRVAPADTHPLTGRADLAVPVEAGGPLVLRSAYRLSLPRVLFEPGLRTRRVDAVHLEKMEPAESDEVDFDPVYQGWLDQVAEAVRAVAAEAETLIPFPQVRRQPRGSRSIAVAAVLLVCLTGVSFFAWTWKRELALAEAPSFEIQVQDLYFGDRTDNVELWSLPANTRDLILHVAADGLPDCDELWLELIDGNGRLLWSGELEAIPYVETALKLPRRFLELGPEAVRVTGRCDGRLEVLLNARVEVEMR